MNKFSKILFLLFFLFSFSNYSLSKENLFNEGVKLFEAKKYDDAKFLLERSIVFNPKHANSYLYLAKIYNHEENQRKEEYNLETTLLIEPDNEEALLMLIKIALEKSNYEKVKDLSDKFVKVCKNLCDENNDIQESLKNIEPDNEEALLMLIKIALEKSNYEKVKDLSDKFVKVCKNLCDENKDIQESLKNIEPENNES